MRGTTTTPSGLIIIFIEQNLISILNKQEMKINPSRYNVFMKINM